MIGEGDTGVSMCELVTTNNYHNLLLNLSHTPSQDNKSDGLEMVGKCPGMQYSVFLTNDAMGQMSRVTSRKSEDTFFCIVCVNVGDLNKIM